MKRQNLILIGIIILSLIFVGCSGVIPDVNQKEKIKEVVNNYWLTIANNQYELAKSYCVKNGIAYNTVIGYQNSFNAGNLPDMDLIPNINWVCVIGNKAVVNLDVKVVVSFGTVITKDLELNLIKIGSVWKLK
jgi:hypothetical protein